MSTAARQAFPSIAPRHIVTLPPALRGAAAVRFAEDVRRRGARVLELRGDLHALGDVEPVALAGTLELLVSERGRPLPPEWVDAAHLVDHDILHAPAEAPPGKLLASHHAERPLSTAEALRLWQRPLAEGCLVKHVEPLGELSRARLGELLETQSQLLERFGHDRVTVLATGPLALPARAVLACRNALDYVAAGPKWSAAPGQRLLDDAGREARASRVLPPHSRRLAILGTGIAYSRSPRIHRQPFDRIDIAEDAPIEALVDALLPHYAGFAVTSPFKPRLARHTGSPLEAINTLVRRGNRWESYSTDTDGAREVLNRLGAREAFVLGDGGVGTALRAVAPEAGCHLRFLRRTELPSEPLSGAGIWTWPDRIPPPQSLRFRDARIAVIAYGPPAHLIAAEITCRGGTPLLLGAAWLIAQARRQRALWETAS